ncbi:diphthine synthase [Oxyplasma meridianum]|uniref:Diphthine synthase n=1 Tax=Oxyplasma meridianum TaxID=3073602 RepID=A0AAX4NF44_9ARCH
MLNLIGMGIRGVHSLTLQEDEILKRSQKIYFEAYTSIAPENTINDLESRYSKPVKPLTRSEVENPEKIIKESLEETVSLIIVGDPLTATTHNQLRFEAEKYGVVVKCYENASIITAAFGYTGLFTYKMAPPISLPFPHEKFFPRSVYDKISKNIENRMHSLILLDLNPGRGMKVSEAVKYLLEMEKNFGNGLLTEFRELIAISDLGHMDEKIVSGSFGSMISYNGGRINCLIIPESPTEDEVRFLSTFCKRLPI